MSSFPACAPGMTSAARVSRSCCCTAGWSTRGSSRRTSTRWPTGSTSSCRSGAVVAMLVAMRRPDLARRLVLISGGFHRDGLMPGMNQFDVDEVVKFLGAAYGEVSPDGAEHFPVVVRKVARMTAEEPALPQSELRGITSRTLVMFADDDLMTLEHVIAMYEGIPNSELAV